MMDPTSTAKGYGKLWDEATVNTNKTSAALVICQTKMIKNKATYQKVEKAIGVPWYFVAALNVRESDGSLLTHLHNGDPLTARTVHVPAGRPRAGSPPFKWYDSAIDALTMPPHSLEGIHWSVERMLYEMERYNGFGYVRRNENSPYVWAWTTKQQPGKYVRDGVFSENAWDTQVGTAALLKTMATLDPAVAAALRVDREAAAPPDVIKQATKKGRTVRTIGAAGGTAGTVKTTATTHTSVSHVAIDMAIVGFGILAFAIGAYMVSHRTKFIQLKWG